MIPDHIRRYFKGCKKLDLADRVAIYNDMTDLLREMVEINHPALAPKLVESCNLQSNDYNPNKVAPPEQKLLELSIMKDGITSPVVAARNDKGRYVIVDGFHRTQVIKYHPSVKATMRGYIPVVELNKSLTDRIAATVRHNMARGAHQTLLSSKLVTLLKKHNWSDQKIGKELGMDADEVLRLKQLTGLAEAFKDLDFTQAWE